MSDFNSFRNAVLEDEDLQEQVMSIAFQVSTFETYRQSKPSLYLQR